MIDSKSFLCEVHACTAQIYLHVIVLLKARKQSAEVYRMIHKWQSHSLLQCKKSVSWQTRVRTIHLISMAKKNGCRLNFEKRKTAIVLKLIAPSYISVTVLKSVITPIWHTWVVHLCKKLEYIIFWNLTPIPDHP